MRVLIIAAMVTMAMAQPALTTEKPGSFFHQIGAVIKDTMGTLTDSVGNYVKDQGQNIITNILPNLGSKLISNGMWSLLGTLINSAHQTSAPTAEAIIGKRDIGADLAALTAKFQEVISEAANRADGLKTITENLIDNLITGRLTPGEYLKAVPDIKVNTDDLLEKMGEGLLKGVHSLLSNKRQVPVDLNEFTTTIHRIVEQGKDLAGQVQQELKALANPANLLSLIAPLLG